MTIARGLLLMIAVVASGCREVVDLAPTDGGGDQDAGYFPDATWLPDAGLPGADAGLPGADATPPDAAIDAS